MSSLSPNDNLIVLGAGKPVIGEAVASLKSIHKETRAIDWIISSFKNIAKNITLVLGYRSDDVLSSYAQLNFAINPNWETTGSLGSLYSAPLDLSNFLYICYSDVLFRSSILKKIKEERADIVVAIDTEWKTRFDRNLDSIAGAEKLLLDQNNKKFSHGKKPSNNHVEFSGLVKLSPKALNILENLREKFKGNKSKEHLPDLLNALLDYPELDFKYVDVAGSWTELDDPRDLSKFILGTKAQTLSRLQTHVSKSKILDQVSFSVKDWNSNQLLIIKKIQQTFSKNKIIVRSSALTEDGFSSANAGAYDSVLNVETSTDEILIAVEKVISSYSQQADNNQVLVQEMLKNVVRSGVIFTRTLNHGAPYICINHTKSNDTTSITSGDSNNDEITLISKNSKTNLRYDEFEAKTLEVINELENLIGLDALDIEFAIDSKNTFYILQVRPIAVDHNDNNFSDEEIFRQIEISKKRFNEYNEFQGLLHGERACFGVMPDWNPAEIIGVTPNKLSSSLYQYLITNEIWAKSRTEFGYKNITEKELMVFFCGRPYIDIRASLNSFIPKSISSELSSKIVNYSIKHLINNPWLHDKIEFEVIPTCYSFDFSNWEKRLKSANFTKNEIEELKLGLKEISINAIEMTHSEEDRIKRLKERFENLKKQKASPLLKVKILLEDCKNLGTIAFANLARCAFVAVSHLKGLVAENAISNNEMNDFLNSVTTVANELLNDAGLVKKGSFKRDEFIEKYGHLRPGTYDILSDSYGSDPGRYLLPIIEQTYKCNDSKFSFIDLPKNRKEEIKKLIKQIDPEMTVLSFEDFLRKSISMREYYKFVFTRNLSAALDLINDYCKGIGLDRSIVSNVSINDLFEIQSGLNTELDIKSYLEQRASFNKNQSKLAKIIELPPVLFDETQFSIFSFDKVLPNFVSTGSVTNEIKFVEAANINENEIKNKVVLISHADPGFDWIFSCGIKGLITKYGGANSHMAIRCAEFGLPAAIGVGDVLFEKLLHAKVINLDCNNKMIKKVQ